MTGKRQRRFTLIAIIGLLTVVVLAPTVLAGIATSPLGLREPTVFAGLGSCPLGSPSPVPGTTAGCPLHR